MKAANLTWVFMDSGMFKTENIPGNEAYSGNPYTG
jgi:hypothetical protein